MITEPAGGGTPGHLVRFGIAVPARRGLRSHVRIWSELFIDVDLCLF
jgi:hypothetical protein